MTLTVLFVGDYLSPRNRRNREVIPKHIPLESMRDWSSSKPRSRIQQIHEMSITRYQKISQVALSGILDESLTIHVVTSPRKKRATAWWCLLALCFKLLRSLRVVGCPTHKTRQQMVNRCTLISEESLIISCTVSIGKWCTYWMFLTITISYSWTSFNVAFYHPNMLVLSCHQVISASNVAQVPSTQQSCMGPIDTYEWDPIDCLGS